MKAAPLLTSWFISTALAVNFAPAHGVPGRFSGEITAIEQSSAEPAHFSERPNARIFAWRLLQEGQSHLTAAQITEARLIHALLERADTLLTPSASPAERAAAIRVRSAAYERMDALLRELPNRIRLERQEDGTVLFDGDQIIQLAGDSGMIVFEIIDGPGVGYMESLPFNLMPEDVAILPENDPPLALPYEPGTTSWVMLRVSNVPQEPPVLFMDVLPAGSRETPQNSFYVRLQAGPRGQLSMNLQDEGGNFTPAMLRLTHQDTGFLHRPSGAIEFAPQMDDIAGEPVPSRAHPFPQSNAPYPHWIPGAWGGQYWCVAEPFSQSLPAGDWKVHLWKGPEFEPVEMDFTVRTGETTQVEVPVRRWIDMPARGWHSGDAHIHSRLMSDEDADRLLVWLEAADISVGNIVAMGNYLRTFFEQRGFGPEYRVQRGNRVLVPGQEDPRFANGHALALNIRGGMVRDRDKYLYNDWVAQQTREAGGLYGHAHMTFNGFNVRRDLTQLMPRGLSDFGEVLQIGRLDTTLWYDFLDLGFPLTGAAGSDVPYSHALGEVRYYVYTGKETLDPDAWFEGMKAGHAFVTNGPMLTFTVNGALPGETLSFDTDATLDVTARAETLPARGAGLKALRIYSHGDLIGEISSADSDTGKLEVRIRVPVAGGRWIAAEAENHDGTMAHTTPVYVQRGDLRWWDYEEVPEQIAIARQTLDELEAEMISAMEQWDAGRVPAWNFYFRTLREMVPGQLERIRETRRLYDELEAEWKAEAEVRKSLGVL